MPWPGAAGGPGRTPPAARRPGGPPVSWHDLAVLAVLDPGQHVAMLDREGRLLAEVARRTPLDAPVPTCPGWALRQLIAHLGFVHRWAASYVAESREVMVEEPAEAGVLALAPPDDALLGWFVDGHAALVSTLAGAAPDLRCWTFLPAPSPLAFWARRQAHETAVHRVDAELAAGSTPSPIDPALAADGIEELLTGFLARKRRYASGDDSPGTLGLQATDVDLGWTLQVGELGVEASAGLAESDCLVRGPVDDLYLLLWNRRTYDGLETEGSAELLESWRRRFRVTWS